MCAKLAVALATELLWNWHLCPMLGTVDCIIRGVFNADGSIILLVSPGWEDPARGCNTTLLTRIKSSLSRGLNLHSRKSKSLPYCSTVDFIPISFLIYFWTTFDFASMSGVIWSVS